MSTLFFSFVFFFAIKEALQYFVNIVEIRFHSLLEALTSMSAKYYCTTGIRGFAMRFKIQLAIGWSSNERPHWGHWLHRLKFFKVLKTDTYVLIISWVKNKIIKHYWRRFHKHDIKKCLFCLKWCSWCAQWPRLFKVEGEVSRCNRYKTEDSLVRAVDQYLPNMFKETSTTDRQCFLNGVVGPFKSYNGHSIICLGSKSYRKLKTYPSYLSVINIGHVISLNFARNGTNLTCIPIFIVRWERHRREPSRRWKKVRDSARNKKRRRSRSCKCRRFLDG